VVRFGPPDASSLIVRKLLETPILTVAAPAYLERHGQPRSPHDLVHHEALLFRDPQTGLPFPWEFHRGGEIVEVKVSGRLVLDDPSVAVAACVAGQGIFQSLAIGLAPLLSRGELIQILPEWSEELYPLYAYHASRHLAPPRAGEGPSASGFHPGDCCLRVTDTRLVRYPPRAGAVLLPAGSSAKVSAPMHRHEYGFLCQWLCDCKPVIPR
jgi:hypothetical protein